jgi:hypothetical protein
MPSPADYITGDDIPCRFAHAMLCPPPGFYIWAYSRCELSHYGRFPLPAAIPDKHRPHAEGPSVSPEERVI